MLYVDKSKKITRIRTIDSGADRNPHRYGKRHVGVKKTKIERKTTILEEF